jgi:hypothetical protein
LGAERDAEHVVETVGDKLPVGATVAADVPVREANR